MYLHEWHVQTIIHLHVQNRSPNREDSVLLTTICAGLGGIPVYHDTIKQFRRENVPVVMTDLILFSYGALV